MTNYTELSQSPKDFLAMTGYTLAEFQALLPHFAKRFEAYVAVHTLDGELRQNRCYSTYHNSPLPTLEDKLLFIMTYLKTNNLQTIHGQLFQMPQPVANKWIHLLLPILKQALAEQGELPARDMSQVVFNEQEEALYFHDGTERPIPRPTDSVEQQEYYSGKEKQHSVKNNVLITAPCRVIFLTATVAGRKHDKRLADESGYRLPKGSILMQDTGFQGFTVDGVTILQPKKKPKGQELTDDEKAINRLISSIRIRIEHAIGGVKRYRVVKDKLRLWKEGVRDLVLEICCGLHNFRLRFRPWHYDLSPEQAALLNS
jgi:hypothetical protein